MLTEYSPEKYRPTSREWIGAVWRCHCGQHWHADETAIWWRVSRRKAARIIRKGL
jgi:hypothetical protein